MGIIYHFEFDFSNLISNALQIGAYKVSSWLAGKFCSEPFQVYIMLYML